MLIGEELTPSRKARAYRFVVFVRRFHYTLFIRESAYILCLESQSSDNNYHNWKYENYLLAI